MEEIVEKIEHYALKKDKLNQTSSLTSFNKLGLVGCGNVGQSIARMASEHGLDVIFIEISPEKIQESFDDLNRDLDKMIERWGMTESEKRAILSRIKGSIDARELGGCDIVIEAIKSKTRENSVEIRKQIFQSIERNVSEKAIIATNSSTLVITELSSEIQHPERCVSFHFLSPAPEAKIVEVVKGLYTSDEVYESVCRFARLLNKRVIPVIESPGIISTRLIVPWINEACEILMEGVGSMEDIDATMTLGFGLPLGPFAMADKLGLDKVVRWLDNLYKEFGDVKYKTSPLLRKLVRANRLGRSIGKGFYDYDEEGNKIIKS
ncbi:MAG: 3-hydroxyacyl-CoA dehydrogenase family protein [Candidatus Cyclobacteriaceae bacterium M3_2C_046]